MGKTLRKLTIAAAAPCLTVGLLAPAAGGVAAPAEEPGGSFDLILAASLAASANGMQEECYTADPESDGVGAVMGIKLVNGNWLWLDSVDMRDETGEFWTYAGKGLAKYLQFTVPIDPIGTARLRKAGKPNALGTREQVFGSQRDWRNFVFDAAWFHGPVRRIRPHVWGDRSQRWQVDHGVLVAHWQARTPRSSWNCSFHYGDTTVPKLGKDSRYLTKRWISRHHFVLGSHLPLNDEQYVGKLQ